VSSAFPECVPTPAPTHREGTSGAPENETLPSRARARRPGARSGSGAFTGGTLSALRGPTPARSQPSGRCVELRQQRAHRRRDADGGELRGMREAGVAADLVRHAAGVALEGEHAVREHALRSRDERPHHRPVAEPRPERVAQRARAIRAGADLRGRELPQPREEPTSRRAHEQDRAILPHDAAGEPQREARRAAARRRDLRGPAGRVRRAVRSDRAARAGSDRPGDPRGRARRRAPRAARGPRPQRDRPRRGTRGPARAPRSRPPRARGSRRRCSPPHRPCTVRIRAGLEAPRATRAGRRGGRARRAPRRGGSGRARSSRGRSRARRPPPPRRARAPRASGSARRSARSRGRRPPPASAGASPPPARRGRAPRRAAGSATGARGGARRTRRGGAAGGRRGGRTGPARGEATGEAARGQTRRPGPLARSGPRGRPGAPATSAASRTPPSRCS